MLRHSVRKIGIEMPLSTETYYEIRTSDISDYSIIYKPTNTTIQNMLTEQEAKRIAELLNRNAEENMAMAEKAKVEALEELRQKKELAQQEGAIRRDLFRKQG